MKAFLCIRDLYRTALKHIESQHLYGKWMQNVLYNSMHPMFNQILSKLGLYQWYTDASVIPTQLHAYVPPGQQQ